MRTWWPRLVRKLLALTALVILGGLASATLVRFAPGYGVDERELDPRLSGASVEAMRAAHQREANLLSYYAAYLRHAASGDLGTSESLQRPIAELIRQRFAVTARAVLLGTTIAWLAALLTVTFGHFLSGWIFETSSSLLSGLLLALPATVVALVFVWLRGPIFLAIACLTFPRLFRFLHHLLRQAKDQPHVLAAQARGIRPGRIFLRHVVLFALPAMVALLGVSVSMAFGAAIPIEALSDTPGLGQLAWYAAINRDLPLIINVTLIVTLVTVASNFAADSSCRMALRSP
jgi:peptide/nickel transport system permease protein